MLSVSAKVRLVWVVAASCFSVVTARTQTISKLSVSPTAVVGGKSATGTVTLSKAPASGQVSITLSASSNAVSIPEGVTISSGNKTANFSIGSSPLAEAKTVKITAQFGKSSASATVAVQPPKLLTFSVNPGSLLGGSSATGLVTLTGAAPFGGAAIKLAATSTSVLAPKTVTIASGQAATTFANPTASVSKPIQVRLTASYDSSAIGISMTVSPPTLASLSVAPSAISGGGTSVGTVTLTSPAPGGGMKVSVRSDTTAAIVPAAVMVKAGASSVTFNILGAKVKSSVDANIKATDPFGNIASSTLMVTMANLVTMPGLRGDLAVISPNGFYIAAPSITNGHLMLVRTVDGKVTDLGTLGQVGSGYDAPSAVSNDGKIIAGTENRYFQSGSLSVPFVYQQPTGFLSLPLRDGGSGWTSAMSEDGTLVVGGMYAANLNLYVACSWINGVTSVLPGQNSGRTAYASAVTADGSVWGTSTNGEDGAIVRWDASGQHWIGGSMYHSGLACISRSGNLIGLGSDFGSKLMDLNGVVTPLSQTNTKLYIYAMSGDGGIIVGTDGSGSGQGQAFLYTTASKRLQYISDIAIAAGLGSRIGNGKMTSAKGVSTDGHVVIGGIAGLSDSTLPGLYYFFMP